MRLLNSTSLKMEDFFGDQTPPYGILSHCWEREEVTFQEMKNISTNPSTRFKAGYKKIKRCAQEVKKGGLEWLWVDTCKWFVSICLDTIDNKSCYNSRFKRIAHMFMLSIIPALRHTLLKMNANGTRLYRQVFFSRTY